MNVKGPNRPVADIQQTSANKYCRQNNSRLEELSGKVSALRGVTIDIYDNARNQEIIDNSVRFRSSPRRGIHTSGF